MSDLTVIIPSRNAANLVACVEAIGEHEPSVQVVVIDDGVDWNEAGSVADSCEVFLGKKPFVFARNVNLGIAHVAAMRFPVQYTDVVLLNDDAILESPGGFTKMQESAREHPDVAIVSSVTNIANNLQQVRKGDVVEMRQVGNERWPLRISRRSPGLSFPAVAFVCVLIPARTLQTIGLLDERFTAYGWEDVDFCRRIHDAGQLIGIHDGCFVDHSKLTSTFRGDPKAAGKIEEGREIFVRKWGNL